MSLSFGILLISGIPISESVLWDLQIMLNVVNDPIISNENPVVSGQVIDHAGKAIQNAKVQIRIGAETFSTNSSETGEFQHEFVGLQLIPGTHVVNVIAVSDEEKIGLHSTEFQVKGELEAFSYTAKLLETPEAMRYLNSDPADFEFDPIGFILYNYYQKLYEEFLLEQSVQKDIEEQEKALDELRQISVDISQKIIDEENPGAGTFSGLDRDIFVDNLDLSIRDIIVNQLNYTLTVFTEAQNAMDEILQNGGTIKEARQAYFEKASISQETMNSLTVVNQDNSTENHLTNSTEPIEYISELQNSTNTNLDTTEDELSLNIDGTSIKVGMSGTIIYLNVNGTVIEFLVNGTEIIQITNSSVN